jgi:hypothetical protein
VCGTAQTKRRFQLPDSSFFSSQPEWVERPVRTEGVRDGADWGGGSVCVGCVCVCEYGVCVSCVCVSMCVFVAVIIVA